MQGGWKLEIEIVEITEPGEKSSVCDRILRALPSWFGIEESIVEYVRAVRELPFFAAALDGAVIGFAALKVHNRHTCEICVTGVLKEYHRRGAGRRLVERCEEYCAHNAMEFLTVKTLDESAKSESYDRTRRFYYAVGFRPLEVFPLLWDERNPCLLMAKHIGNS